jgi:hypothetical protein
MKEIGKMKQIGNRKNHLQNSLRQILEECVDK